MGPTAACSVTQQARRDGGRTRIEAQALARDTVRARLPGVVVSRHQSTVASEERRQRIDGTEPLDAARVLPIPARALAAQVVAPAAGVRVDAGEGLVLAQQVLEQMHEHRVLEYVGVVARVEAVEVAEHGRPAAPGAPPASRQTIVEPPSTTQFCPVQ